MKIKLATVNLQVADPQRSKLFYIDLLAMVEDTGRSHPPGFVYLRSDGCDLTIAGPFEPFPGAPAGAVKSAPPSPTIELGFEVDDLAALRSRIDAQGRREYRAESMGWGQAIELVDDDGHRVVVYQFRGGPGEGPE